MADLSRSALKQCELVDGVGIFILTGKRRKEVVMAIFATKKVTISTSKKGIKVSPKGKSSKKKGK